MIFMATRCAVTFAEGGDTRQRLAQALCRASLDACGLTVVELCGDPRPRFGEMLRAAREHAGEWFAWVNGDCQLLLPPESINCTAIDVLGMRRVEVGAGTICAGVDGYLIRSAFWDACLSSDVPEMWVGASHVDWWLSRAAQKFGRYAETVCLAHLPHERTATSLGTDRFGAENIANYEAWADRHGVSKC